MSTIVIVDDDAGFRLQVSEILQADGFVVVGQATDAASGLEAVRATHPDFVLLDIGLPDMNGIEVARILAADGPPPLVVLTSSRDARAYGKRLLGAQSLGFIPKDQVSAGAIRALVT
jgi:DNA-binding NarL/FixJ family response regulator